MYMAPVKEKDGLNLTLGKYFGCLNFLNKNIPFLPEKKYQRCVREHSHQFAIWEIAVRYARKCSV